ncbi:unnamed protein product [Paramecium primaurelia]|uniref:Uncharacterized protein n=1 Tax=Paramecium primaurelia TaxID=5886 RepID=A0A8S1PIS1_PARPR|nr:unnamed protein product [Paramecium primaurelia]
MKKKYNQVRQHSFQIPKITSLQPLFTTYNDNHTEPTTPIKIDLKSKQEQMKLELDQKNKYLEQIISLKQERYHHNRKELLYHKLQNIEQQLHKWNQTRKNIEFIKKAKQQYLCEYYNSQLSSKPIQTRQTQYKNTSFNDFQQTKTYVRNAQSQPRKQSFFNIQYQKKINEIEKRVHVMQRKLKLGNLDSQISNSFQILIQDYSQ